MVRAAVTRQSNMAAFKTRMREIAKTRVLVGIPQANSLRSADGGGGITNAELLYIHTHGVRQKSMREDMKSDMDQGKKYSEAYQLYVQSHGSPLWHSPLRPVLEPAMDYHKDAIKTDLSAAVKLYLQTGRDTGYRKVGMFGAAMAKGWFEHPANGWAPNSPKTIIKKGSESPLIDTGAMRQAITYVVDKGDV